MRRTRFTLTAVVVGVMLPALAGLPAAAQGDAEPVVGSATLVPIQVTGPAEQRLNLVVLGDGYTAAEMDKFREQVDLHLNVQWSIEPFRSYRNYFNVYALEIVSRDSGIRCDPEHSPRGGDITKDTPLRLWYSLLGEPGGCADPNSRGITYGPAPAGSPAGTPDGNQQRTMYLNQYVAPVLGIPANSQNIQTLALANTTTYGGIGGVHATTSGGSPQGPLISPHELGHSLGNLLDEYPYLLRGVPGGPHTGGEPGSLHHTVMTEQQMLTQKAKWWRWMGEDSESGGRIGMHESGLQKSSGVFRPSKHSMMRWLGYHFDQISREHMTYRITGLRNANEMPLSHTPEGEVGPSDVVWVETMHPKYHELDVAWSINGQVVQGTGNSRDLELADLDVVPGDVVGATVFDPTDFVRDPTFQAGPRMTQSRQWTVGRPLEPAPVEAAFTAWTQTERAVGGQEVVYVETTHPTARVLDVVWALDGTAIDNPGNSRNLDLGELDLTPGTHELRATLSDPAAPAGPSQDLRWRVDNAAPQVDLELSAPVRTAAGEPAHNVYCEQFTMGLEPTDAEPGHVVGEFRLDGDGWHNYYGWPDAQPGTPFLFTPSGTNIKEIIYGALSPGGMVWAPFEQREPGYGTHTVEYRAIDAAGNISPPQEFKVTVLPRTSSECLPILPSALRWAAEATVLPRSSVR